MDTERLVIDVREPSEYVTDHVRGSINIPLDELISGAKKLENTPKDTEIILYCASGGRSNSAMQYLEQLGFTNLVNGINAANVKITYSL